MTAMKNLYLIPMTTTKAMFHRIHWVTKPCISLFFLSVFNNLFMFPKGLMTQLTRVTERLKSNQRKFASLKHSRRPTKQLKLTTGNIPC